MWLWLPDATACLIYQYSIKTVMKSMLCMHRHTCNEMHFSLPLLFNWNGSVTFTPYHLSLCAYIKLHPTGWALRWNIMQIPNNKCTWLNSLSQQPEPCLRTHTHHIDLKCAFVCVWICVLTHTFMLCLLTMSVSAQTSGIKTVKLPKLTSMRQSCSAFHLDLKEGKNNSFVPILNLRVSFRS